MAVQKNFVVRNGIEVNNNLLVADTSTDHVGVGTSTPKNKLEVIGGIGATHINILGISTVVTEFHVGTGGTVITSLNTGLTGFGTASPAYILDIRSPVSTGQTALYVQGDVEITGDLYADDINLDQATFNNIEVVGVATVGILTANDLYAGFTTTSSLAVVNPTLAVLTVGHDIDGSGQDHLGIYYDNSLGTPGTGGTANIFTSNGDLRFDVVDGISNFIFGSQFTNNYVTINGTDGALTVAGLVTATDAYIGFGTVVIFQSDDGIITTLSGSNLTYSGIGTINTASVDLAYVKTGIVTNLTTSGIATIATASVDLAYVKTGIVTNLTTSGIGTINTASIDLGYVKTGIVTNLTTTGIGTINTASVDLAYVKTGIVTNLTTSGIGTLATASVDLAYVKTGIVTNLTTTGIASITTGVVNTAYVNTGIVTTLSGSNLNYSGIGSFGSINTPTARIVTGIVTTIDNTNLTVSGIASITNGVVNTAYVNTGIVTTLSGSNLSYSGIGTITTASVDLAYVKTGIVTNLRTTGIASIATGVITSAYINTGIVTTLSSANVTVSGLTTTGTLAVNSGFDVYAADSTFHGSVTIEGNLSIGGTSTIINAAQLRIEDKDIIVGFTTTLTPSDDTANHGGIAVASTEGTPLVSLFAAGINTLPDTYKQMMWVKRNTMGAGTTDAFLFNYGVGIGSTQVPNGVRLAVGSVQVTDNQVNTTNLNVTGVGTINTANITNLSISGVVTSGGYNIGIQSGGLSVTTGVITSLNFIGAGNTFSYNAGTKTVDINIGGSQWTFTDQANPTTSSIYRVNGNVGIGTTNPTSKLSVNNGDIVLTNNSDPRVYIQIGEGGSGGGGFDIKKSDNSWSWRFTGEPDGFKIRDHLNSLDKFYIEDGATGNVWFNNIQNVGVGTTNPAEKLTVVGNTLLTGDVGINTTSITNPNLTGVGNSFNGVYIANGMIIVDNTLEGNHYIGTSYNGLMAGPVTINGILTVDGNYVVV